MRYRLLLLSLLVAGTLFSQTIPVHKRLLYSDSLTSGASTKMGLLTNKGGEFLPGRGWKASTQNSQLVITLPADLPAEGTFIINVTNFDPVTQSVDAKQNILSMASHLDMYSTPQYDTGSWWLYRTGTGYTDGPGMAGFRIDYAPRGVDTRSDGRAMQSSTWNYKRTYEFKVIWQASWISFYIDGNLIMDPKISGTGWSGQNQFFRYIFVNRDSKGYPGQPGPIWFNARILVPGPSLAMSKVSGDSQSADTGATLAAPLVVKVADTDGNPQANVPVTFTFTSGSGQIVEAQPVSTDAAGLAAIHVTLGATAGPYTLQAAVAGAAGSPVAFTATATVPASRTLQLVSGGGQSGTPGQPLPAPIVVQVRDQFNNPAAAHSLLFSVAAGGGTLQGQSTLTLLTDSEGKAAALWSMGPYRGVAQLMQISSSFNGQPMQGSPLTVEAGLGAPPDSARSSLSATSPLLANGSETSNITLTLRDATGQLLSGYLVRLAASGTGNQFTMADSLTNSSGQVTATLTSTAAGSKIITARIAGFEWTLTATVLFNPPPQTAASIQLVSGDNQTGTVGSLLAAELVVRVTDNKGAAVTAYPVDFTVLSGSATISGETTHRVMTDAQGLARAALTLGTTAGTISVTARTAPLATLVPFTARATSGAAYRMSAQSGFTQSGTPGRTLTNPIVAAITDRYGNPVAGYAVQFEVVSGGGNMNGARAQVVVSDAAGTASAFWTLGRYLGAFNQLVVSSTSSESVLTGAPLLMEIALPVLPENTLSTVSATTPVIADGSAWSDISVTLRDAASRPLAGFTVDITASGQRNVISLTDSISSRDGLVRAKLRSTTAELKSVSAFIKGAGFTLADTAQVRFVAPALLDQLLYVSGDDQTGRINTPLPAPLVLRVLGHEKEPKGGVTVELSVVAGGGLVNRKTTCSVFSDTAGYCRVLWSMGPVAGRRNNLLTARIRGLEQTTLTLKASAAASEPAQWAIVSGNQQNGIVGRALAAPFIIQMGDANGNPVADLAVLFKVTQGDARFAGSPEFATRSDASGLASALLTLGEQATTSVIQVYAGDAPLPPLLFTATAAPEAPAALVKVSPDSQRIALPGADGVKLTLRLTDRFGNPLAGVQVSIAAPDGGHVLSQPILLTDARGEALFQVRPADSPGLVHFDCQSTGGISTLWTLIGYFPESNRAPIIAGFSPADTALALVAPGTSLSFAFNTVLDPDGDAILFEWRVNGNPVDHQPSLTLVVNPTLAVDEDGNFTVTGSVSDGKLTTEVHWRFLLNRTGVAAEPATILPQVIELGQNYPNPFNATTTFTLSLPLRQSAALRIFNLSGELVQTLCEGERAAGIHRLIWQGRNLKGEAAPSGVYYAVLQTGGIRQTRKLVLMR